MFNQLLLLFLFQAYVHLMNKKSDPGFDHTAPFCYKRPSIVASLGADSDFKTILAFIIKFRSNARADWLKQRALSEYRCTEQRCQPSARLICEIPGLLSRFYLFIIIIIIF